jgi:quinol monooxygenase YgiN
MRTFFLTLALALMTNLAVNAQTTPSSSMMVRIAEIEIDSTYLEEYMVILKEESSMSVKLETGVISIFPMFQKEHPTTFRLLEIYASREAYEAHLKTPHFLHYKKGNFTHGKIS